MRNLLILCFAVWQLSAIAEEVATAETDPKLKQTLAALPVTSASGVATAATPNQITAQSTATFNPKTFGLLDLRPSVATNNGQLRSENTVEAGYQFTSDTRLTYTQWWNTTKNFSEGLYAHDGFLRLRVNNIYKSGNFAVNYQARLVLPTFGARREAGYVVGIYNQLSASVDLNSTLNLTVTMAPQFNHFSRASHNGKINSALVNLGIVNLDVKLSEPLLFSFPVFFISTKSRTAAGVAGSSDWSHLVVVWPELAYTLSSHHTVGLSYYSDSLVNSSFTQLTLANAFSKGVLQAFWTMRL